MPGGFGSVRCCRWRGLAASPSARRRRTTFPVGFWRFIRLVLLRRQISIRFRKLAARIRQAPRALKRPAGALSTIRLPPAGQPAATVAASSSASLLAADAAPQPVACTPPPLSTAALAAGNETAEQSQGAHQFLDSIERLCRLRDSGHLNDAEFDAAKRKLLSL